jgi:hypothetical protein
MTKPRKKYRPKPVVMPLGMRDNFAFEMPALQALSALGQPHFCEQHVYDLIATGDMTKRIAPADHEIVAVAQPVIDVCADIQERAQRTGKTGVTGDEVRVLRDGVPKLIAFIRRSPNPAIYRAALAAHDEFNRTGELRV